MTVSTAIVLITPVVVMAAGQLAGGLAWLTISGEDAADLVTTAPLPPSRVTRAKIEVVLIAIGVMFAPLIAALAIRLAAARRRSPHLCVVTAAGIGYFDTALVSGTGPPQPVSPPPDVVAAGDFRRSIFLDRMGRDRGAGAVAALYRRYHRPADRLHPGGNMEDQPQAGVIPTITTRKSLSDK